MIGLIRSRIFAAAFFVSYFLFFYVTIFVLEIQGPGFGVGHTEYGFPLTYYYSHCFGGYYIWSGLIGNAIFASLMSAVIALACSRVWIQLWSPQFRAKWYL